MIKLALVIASPLVCAGLVASGYFYGYQACKKSMEAEYAKQLATAVQAEHDKQTAKDEERAAALKSASDWRTKYNRVLKSRPSNPTDLQACIRERDRLRELAEGCYGVVGQARENFDKLRIEWK